MTDRKYRHWISTHPSFLDGEYTEFVNGQGRNPACHVRRAGSSGIAYKAPYSCVPMTQEQHLYQHQHGELACLQKYARCIIFTPTVEGAKACFDRHVEIYRKVYEREKANGFR